MALIERQQNAPSPYLGIWTRNRKTTAESAIGTRDLTGFGENAHLALCAAGVLLQYVKDTQRTALPHIRSITMERPQDSIILDAATRRNLN